MMGVTGFREETKPRAFSGCEVRVKHENESSCEQVQYPPSKRQGEEGEEQDKVVYAFLALLGLALVAAFLGVAFKNKQSQPSPK